MKNMKTADYIKIAIAFLFAVLQVGCMAAKIETTHTVEPIVINLNVKVTVAMETATNKAL
ncbi:MAG TPA: hypothetical protein PLA71_00315 [Saccharofermentans sp.]|nr:hypothetical protein [Saccharofermentans sp.]